MAGDAYIFELSACRDLMDNHPESLVIAEQVKAIESAMPSSPGLAVAACRTVIETTCKTILVDRGQTPDENWKAPKLLAETKKFLNFGVLDSGHTDAKLKGATEQVVQGVASIVSGLSAIRNDYGTGAHGPDAYAPVLDERYAEIIARSTDAVVGFLFKTHLRNSTKASMTRLRYGDHKEFDDWVDTDFGPFEILETPLIASEALFRTDQNAYKSALAVYKQEQAALSQSEPGETEA